MNSKLSEALKVLFFAALGLLILYLMYRSQQAAYLEDCINTNPNDNCSFIDKLIADFSSVSWVWIIIVLCVYMISSISRSLRWQQILKADNYSPGFLNTLGALMIGYFVNLGVPRAGEIVKTGILSRNESIPFEKVLASVVIDRVADILSLLVVLAIALLISSDIIFSFFQDNFKISTLYQLGALALFGLIALVVFLFWLKNQIATGRDTWIVNKSKSFLDGITSITNLENVSVFILHSIIIWTCYYLMTYLCFFAFGPTEHLGAKAGMVIFVLGTLGIVFPSPGGMGSYHFLVTNGLLLFGLANSDAFAFSNIIFFAIQLFCNVLFGGIFLVLLPIINGRKDNT